jgi:class 3 adenylate cyclase
VSSWPAAGDDRVERIRLDVPEGGGIAGSGLYAVSVETLTFLFTDIEGSTALLRRLGDDGYAQVLVAITR